MLRRQSLQNQTSPKTDFTAIFLKCWATLWAWKVHLGFVRTSHAGGESGQEISSTTQLVPPPAPAAPAPAAEENGDRPADEPPTPQACEGAEAGTCCPAPCEGAVSQVAYSG